MIPLRVSIGLLCITLLVPSFVISSNLNVYEAYRDFLYDMNGLVLDVDKKSDFETLKAHLLKLTLNSAAFVLSSFEVHDMLTNLSAQWDKLESIETTQQKLNSKVRSMSSKFLFREKDTVNWPPLALYKGTFKKNTTRKAMEKSCTTYLDNSSYSFENSQWKDHHTYRLMHLDASAPVGRTIYAALSLAKLTIDYTTTMFCHSVLNVPFIPNFMGIIANSVLFMRSWYQTEMKYPSKSSFGESILNEMGAIPTNDGVTSLARILAQKQFQKTKDLILEDPSHKNLVWKVHDLYFDIFKLTNQSTVAVSFNGNKDKGKKWYYIQHDQVEYGAHLFEENDKKAVFVGSYNKGVNYGILSDCESDVGDKNVKIREKNEKDFLEHKAKYIAEGLRDCMREKGVELKAILLVMELDDYGYHSYEGTTVDEADKRMLYHHLIKTRWQYAWLYGGERKDSTVNYIAIPL